MEKVLDRETIDRGCVLTKNSLGLYDLMVNDEEGRIVASEKNISFMRAVSVIEDNMYLTGRGEA